MDIELENKSYESDERGRRASGEVPYRRAAGSVAEHNAPGVSEQPGPICRRIGEAAESLGVSEHRIRNTSNCCEQKDACFETSRARTLFDT